MECTLEDVEALLSHVNKVPDVWRKAVGGACAALHDAIVQVCCSKNNVSMDLGLFSLNLTACDRGCAQLRHR